MADLPAELRQQCDGEPGWSVPPGHGRTGLPVLQLHGRGAEHAGEMGIIIITILIVIIIIIIIIIIMCSPYH
jgi:hypothetical protein